MNCLFKFRKHGLTEQSCPEAFQKIVKEGLAPLGEEYLSLLETGFEGRWIDVYENEGKRSLFLRDM